MALLLLLVIPLLRFSSIPFYTYRIFLIHIILVLYFIIVLIRNMRQKSTIQVSLSMIDVLFIAYYCFYFLSYIYSKNIAVSFISLLTEVPFILVYVFFRLFFHEEKNSGDTKKDIIRYAIAAMGTVAIWGLLQYFFEFDVSVGLKSLFKTYHFPVIASLGNPNFLGEFIVFLMPIVISYFSFYRKYILMGLFIIIGGLTVFLTYSRLAWFGIIICASGTLLFSAKRSKKWIVVHFLILFMVSFSFFVYHAQTESTRARRVVNSLSLSESSLFKEREVIYLAGKEMFANSSLLGMGPGSFACNYLEYQGKAAGKLKMANSNHRLIDLDHAHSDFLEIGIESGYIGLFLFLFLVGLSVFNGIRNLLQGKEEDIHRFLNMVPIIYIPFGIWAFPMYLPFSKMILYFSLAYIASRRQFTFYSGKNWRVAPLMASLLIVFLLFFHGRYVFSVIYYGNGLTSFNRSYDKSFNAFTAGIKAFPYNGYNYFSLGALLLNHGERTGIAHLKRSLEYLKMTRTYIYIARGYRDFGDYRNALKWYRLLIKMRPDLKKVKSEFEELLDSPPDD